MTFLSLTQKTDDSTIQTPHRPFSSKPQNKLIILQLVSGNEDRVLLSSQVLGKE
jgi:hypothetical protein